MTVTRSNLTRNDTCRVSFRGGGRGIRPPLLDVCPPLKFYYIYCIVQHVALAPPGMRKQLFCPPGQRDLYKHFLTLLQVCVFISLTQYLIIHQRSLYNHPAGLLPRARILVSREGDYELQILLKTIEKGTVYSESVL